MKIKLTQEHIDMGTPRTRNMMFCPVALALDEATGVLWNASFDCCWPAGFACTKETRVAFTPELYRWQEKYDHGGLVAPEEFDLDMPDIASTHPHAKVPWKVVRNAFLASRHPDPSAS